MKTWMYPSDFPSAARLTRVKLETSFHHLGTVTHMEKSFGGSVANIYLEKVTEAFQTIPSSFGAVVRNRKSGLGVNYPPPHLQGGLSLTS